VNAIWSEKYRPKSLHQMVGNPTFLGRLKRLSTSESERIPHLLLHSQHSGVGKTSLAYALANEWGYSLHHFNASSKKTRGIEFVEDELTMMSQNGQYQQIFLLDEADQLTQAAQSALKGVIEHSQGTFILTCNDISKISPALKSRCQTISFPKVSEEEIIKALARIVSKEKADADIVNPLWLKNIASANDGDLRASINCLQAYVNTPKEEKSSFLLSLHEKELSPAEFLTACFKEKDFDLAFDLITAVSDLRLAVKVIFEFAIANPSEITSKVKVIDAAVQHERDIINGVDSRVAVACFCKTLAK